ncbi:MAG: FliG C-terminal domain-containing protein [Pseudomonadota bacterium]
MGLPATANKATADGILRSARLLRALGPRAAEVWAELPPQDAERIHHVLETLPENAADEAHAVNALLDELETGRAPSDAGSIWRKLATVSREQLLSLLKDEHPQVVALILGRLTPTQSADIVRHLPSLVAIDVLQRMLHMNPPHGVAMAAIEQALEERLERFDDRIEMRETSLARIFDELDPEASKTLLSALQTAEPAAGRRIQTLMFGFEELVTLPAAGIQTLLSRLDRRTLTLAMVGADDGVATALFQNMTSRARDVLKEEIAALGEIHAAAADAARADMTRLARTLIASGDILPSASGTEDLVE